MVPVPQEAFPGVLTARKENRLTAVGSAQKGGRSANTPREGVRLVWQVCQFGLTSF